MTRRLFLKFFLSMGALFFLPKKIYSYEENRILLLSSVVAGFRYYDGEKIWKENVLTCQDQFKVISYS